MTLTEYELADLAMSAQASATPTTALFVTIMTGYLIVAWLVGNKLTRTQVVFINVLFIFFQLSLVVGWSLRWEIYYKYTTILNSIEPTLWDIGYPAVVVAFSIMMCASIPGCLKFLWDVRHPKPK